ncbi:cytochrome c oxidase assembly protein [Blastococcus sp. BMG 814]|uniref:Cytochrome c oxidase assembly protein n=1 Tax=Blastococcus carthaginiensis TaxID=3050034 RepID=A0ABT9I8D3_9ACTN|nr:cytochrome c oxidase assembly protein [Blastococcus carthaginiensis]MDP5181813.1 cytochrome c oxidase assembly protein [Blastococcus carthaginiensis]
MSGELLAHGGAHGGVVWQTAVLVGAAGALAVAYDVGARRLLAAHPTSSWTWRRWAFPAGLAVLVVALLPPLEPVVAASFPLHMTQHVALLMVAAPLLALGASGLPLLLVLPHRRRRQVAAVRSSSPVRRARAVAALPAVVVAGHAAVVSAWHLPGLYSAALASTAVHVTEHAAFLAVGWWFWSLVTTPATELDGRTALYIAASGLPMNLLGAVLTFAPVPLYPAQTGTGPGALTEQQLAGLLMWVPAGAVYLGLCAVVLLLWLRRLERDSPGGTVLPAPDVPGAREPADAGRLATADGRPAS